MAPGDVIAGRFLIERLAEQGGMGSIYLARDRQTGEPVALKLLHAYALTESQLLMREARALLEVRHPGIVRYVAHGDAEDDAGDLEEPSVPYLAMEWIEGEDLRRRLQRAPLSLAESVTMAQRAAEALAVAHGRGVVHRDVKPSNILLAGGQVEQVKLVDFGVARLPSAREDATQEGAVIGTMAYMAPEQARGWKSFDPRADVFSLGCVLFECVTGRRAFVGEDAMAVLAKVLLADLPRARELRSDVPRALDDLLARMLAKEAADRPTAAMVASALSEIASLDLSAGEPSATERPPPMSLRPALTRGEQRLVSVALARPAAPRLDGAALPPADEIHALVAPFGARAEWLADGSLVAFLTAQGGAAADQALQAARCALALRRQLPDAPMALVTGRGELTGGLLVGEAIDRASGLLRAELPRAAGGGARPVRIDAVTAALLDARLHVGGDDLGLLLHGERAPTGEVRTLLGQPTRCMGRERELALLEGVLAACAGGPEARAVLVTAPPGVGKSRLRHEFLRRARGRGRCEVWQGRGDPLSKGSPFGLAAQVLRQAAGLRDDEPLGVQRRKLAARVARNVPPPEAPRVAEFLGEIVGVAFPDDDSPKLRSARKDAMVMGDQMRRAFEDFVAAECAAQPVVLVLEDLQWGDLPTVKLIDATLRSARSRPLLVLALARPEVHAVFPSLWADRAVEPIALGELGRETGERLAREVLGPDVRADVVAQIVERAAGNALYLEELIRAVAEGRGDAPPESVLAMVQSRIEAMEHDARRLLRAASVFGQSFWARGVEALLGYAPEEPTWDAPGTPSEPGPGARVPVQLAQWLVELCEREVVVRTDAGKFAVEEEYTFRHALVREAAYAMLTEADRRLGHALAGDWLERAGERDPAVLAEHFERGGESFRAVVWYLQAAEQALEGNDLEAALSHIERGVRCGASAQTLGMLNLLAAEAYRWRGETAREQTAALDAMRSLPHGSPRWCVAAGQAALASGKLADIARLEAIAADVLALAARGDGSDAVVVAAARTAIPLVLAGRTASAEKLLEHLGRFDGVAAGDPASAAWIHLARATHAAETGDPFTALERMGAATAAFEEAGDARNACAQCLNIGWTSLEVGELERAERALRDGRATAEQLGLQHVVTGAEHLLATALVRRGARGEARALQIASIHAFSARANQRMTAVAQRALAAILLEEGDAEAAAQQAQAAVVTAESQPAIRAYALATLAEIRLRQGRRRDALDAARAAMDLLSELGGIVLGDALVRLVYAEALGANGDAAGAREAIASARDRLLARAAKATDPARRRVFLERVPDNARTLALAARWLGE